MSDFIQSPDSPAVAPTVCAAASPSSPEKTKSHHTRPCYPPPGVLDIPDALLRKSHVLALAGWISDNTLARRIKDGDFPKPDVHSGRNPLWRVQTVRHWLKGEVALGLRRREAELKRQIAEAPDSHQRAELLRENRYLLAQIHRVRRSKKTPVATA